MKRLIEIDGALRVGDRLPLGRVADEASPLSVKATTLGVRRLPSWLGMTLTSPPSMTATTEFVVPRSMPMIFSSAMGVSSLCQCSNGQKW